MPTVATKTELPVSAADVWQVIGGFNALPDWHPGITKSELEGGGTLRRLTLPVGGTVVERLDQHDEHARSYTYSIVDGPLPVSQYTATIRVTDNPDGKGCTVDWSSSFEAEGDENAAIQAIRGVYEAGLANLSKMFGAK